MILRILSLAAVLALSATAQKHNITFEPNLGQAENSIRFIGRINGATVRFSSRSVEFSQRVDQSLALHFVRANDASAWLAEDALASSSSYFLGSDRSKWVHDVPHWRRLVRREIYPGIDVVFYGGQGQLEFDFMVAQGADLSRIRLRWSGSGVRQTVSPAGDLHIHTAGHADLVCRKPRIYQLMDGVQVPIDGRYFLSADGREARFAVGSYNRALPLTIDPVIDSLTFFGAEGTDRVVGIAGNIVVGSTNSVSLLREKTHGRHIFVQNGSSYSIYGGSGEEEPTAIALNGYPAMIAGWTTSKDLPTTSNAGQARFGGGSVDGFYMLLGSEAYTFSYLGGSGDDRVLAVSRDSDSPSDFNVNGYYLAGETNSTDFPVRNAIQPSLAGGKDGFLAHIVPAGLVSSTYWGGSGDDAIYAVDANSSSCWFGGRTTSPDLPVQGALQNQIAGASDGFLVRLNSSTSSLATDFVTYFGGTADDEVRALHLGLDGWIWLGGNTSSADLPVSAAMQATLAGDSDAWVARIHPRGSEVAFATYLGGKGHDELTALTHDLNGDLYVAGFTNSVDFPLRDPLQDHSGGGDDGFLARFGATGGATLVSYFGGAGNDRFRGIWAADDGRLFAVGESDSREIATGLPTAAVPSGDMDGFELVFHQDGIYASDVILGNGLSSNLFVLTRGSFGGAITVRSTDPSKVTVNLGAVATSAGSFQLDGMANEGQVELIVSAPFLAPRRITVTLAPGRLINPYVDELQCPTNSLTSVLFRFGVVRPDTGAVVFQKPSSPTATGVFLQSSEPLTIQPKLYSSNPESSTVTGVLRATSEGAATISIRSPKFAVLGPDTFTARGVSPAKARLQVSDIAVGLLLQTRLTLTQPSAAASSTPFVLRVISEDPSIAVVTNSPAFRGSSATIYVYTPDPRTSNYIWIQGRSRGQTRIRFEADGAEPVYANVAVLPSVAVLSPARYDFSLQPGLLTAQLLSPRTVLAQSAGLYSLICVIDAAVPFGYSTPAQIPSPESENVFTLEFLGDSGSFGGLAAFNLARPDFFLFYSITFPRAGNYRVIARCPGLNSGPALEVTVKELVLPFPVDELILGKDITLQLPFGTPSGFPNNTQVTITSSDPSRVSLGRNFPEEGGKIQTTLNSSGSERIYLTALAAAGDVTVTMTAPNFPARTFVVHLTQTRYRISPSSVTIARGGGGNAVVTWSYPGAPTVGFATVRQNANLTFRLDIADRTIVTAESTISLQGFNRSIGPTALNVGSTTVTLVSTSAAIVDPQYSTLQVTVTPAKSTFAPDAMILGKDLQRPMPGFAYTGTVTPDGIIFRSQDPTRVLLSHSPTTMGSQTLDAKSPVYVQGLADSGDVNIIASVSGYTDAILKVKLLPSAIGFDRHGTGGGVVQKVINGSRTSIRANLFVIDPASGNPISLGDASIRGGLDPFEVRLRMSNPEVGAVASTIVFGPGNFSASTQFRADALGATDLAVEPAPGFADGGSSMVRRIEVTQPVLSLESRSLGKNLQSTLSRPFIEAPLTITSSDPSRLVLSTSPTVLGNQSVTVTALQTVFIQALEGSGEVTLTASAPGFSSATSTVFLQPSYFGFRDAPSDYGTSPEFRFVTNSSNRVRLYPAYPGGGAFNSGTESFRPGLGTVTVPLSILNSGVLGLSSPVEVKPGSQDIAAILVGKEAGTTEVSIGDVPGFAAPPPVERVAKVEVTAHQISLSDARVGQDRVVGVSYSTNEDVAAPTTLRITSSDPSRVLLTTDITSPGSGEVTIELAPRAIRPQLFAIGLASSGTATIAAAAPGLQSRTATVTLVPSGFSFHYSSTTARVGSSQTVGITAAEGRIRPGTAPITVAIDNSNPQVLQLAPVVFLPGDFSQELTFTPLSRGTAVLTIRDHPQGATNVLVVNVQ